ncbi:MAG: hypothetical protein HY904_16875 [Deltaproteobacteria bacterium]|nr:hypothetical protein [Deltaproteobacteria bacterium]
MRLGDLLVQAGYITEDQLMAALVEQRKFGGRLGDILAQKGFCSEDAVARALAKQLGLPFVDLARAPIPPKHVLARLPIDVCLQLNVVPCVFREKDNTLVVALTNPRDKDTVKKLEDTTRWKIQVAVAGTKGIAKARAAFYGHKDEMSLGEEAPDASLLDTQGRTVRKRAEDVEREYVARKAQRSSSANAIPAVPPGMVPAVPVAPPVSPGWGPPPPPPHPMVAQGYPVGPPPPAVAQGYPVAATPPPPPLVQGTVQEIRGFTDSQGRTAIKSVQAIMEEARQKKLAEAARLEAQAEEAKKAKKKPPKLPADAESDAFAPAGSKAPVDTAGLADPAVTTAEDAAEPGPTREELLATIEALRAEVHALKAVAVVLFRKGYVTPAEYQAQMANSVTSA